MYKNQLTHIRSVLYSLKKDYAFRLDLYRKTEVVNLETGRRVTTRVKFKMKKVIILPNQIYRDFNYGSLIKAGSGVAGFQLGGLLDLKQRIIIIDKKELPRDFEIQTNDYLIFNHDRYEIKEITEMELADFWRLVIRQTEGDTPNEIHEQIVSQFLEYSEFLNSNPNQLYSTFKENLSLRQQFGKYVIHSQSILHPFRLIDGIGEAQ